MDILAAIAEFRRARIAERVTAGLAKARANGQRLGRPYATIPVDRLAGVDHLPAKVLRRSWRCRSRPSSGGVAGSNNPSRFPPDFRPVSG